MKNYIEQVKSSLTIRIFLITTLILMTACGLTYGFIAWATPITYSSIQYAELQDRTENLINELEQSTLEDCAPLLADFSASTGAEVKLSDASGDTSGISAMPGSQLLWVTVSRTHSDSDSVAIAGSQSKTVTVAADTVTEDTAVASAPSVTVQGGTSQTQVGEESLTTVISDTQIEYPFYFQDQQTSYTLSVEASVATVNQTVEALEKVLPFLTLVVLTISLLGAVFYSRYITRPIVRISRISQKIADLDFTWRCGGTRPDEIGILGRNLDTLSMRLSAALSELQAANLTLQQDIDRERELEQQRMTFFSAASHELKTPITILKGQLSGMLAGVDIYQNRDKYLARCLAVTGRMEGLVQELLTVSRMENADFVMQREDVDVHTILFAQIEQVKELAVQRQQVLEVQASPVHSIIHGNAALLGRAVANLLTNALFYSPSGAVIRIHLYQGEKGLVMTIQNSGAHLSQETLSHAFDAFYRADVSRSRDTGGSGLGLYLVQMVLDRHHASCSLENTSDGVRVTVQFAQ